MPRGFLKQKTYRRNFTDTLLGVARSADDLADVEIVTLSQHIREDAYKKAWEHGNPDDIVDKIQIYMDSNNSTGKEFVQIKNGHITVGLNVPVITDEETYRAIMLLTQCDNIRKDGIFYFGMETVVVGSDA